MSLLLADIAEKLGAELRGATGDVLVQGLGTLKSATPQQLSFLSNSRYRNFLADTQAAAVLCRAEDAEHARVPVLVVKDPYLAYARISAEFAIEPLPAAGIHPRAVVDDSAQVDATASIGPNVVIEAGAKVGAGAILMANVYVGANAVIGDQVRLWPNVTIYHGVIIGPRTNIHASTVIGCDGFGFAFNGSGWTKVQQIGSVRIGADVDIGSGVTIDRGALDDTLIGNGVILDNQVHLAHNVTVGDGSALAGQVGVSGSTAIGAFCVFAGQVGVAGHLKIEDRVQVLGKSMESKSQPAGGTYAAGLPADRQESWRRNVVRFRQLDELAKQLKAVQKRLDELQSGES